MKMKYIFLSILTTSLVLRATTNLVAGTILIDHYYSSDAKRFTDKMELELETNGHTIYHNTSPITEDALASFDTYVLFLPGQINDLTLSEANIISNWVEAGHGLWLGGGRQTIDNIPDNCNTISSRWGVTYNKNDCSGVITDITYGHFVTDGINLPDTQVNEFGIYLACTLSLTDGISLARYEGNTIMAVVEPGNGRAILIGDSISKGPFDNTYLYEYDNLSLALNTIEYLVPEPGTVLLFGLGALFIRSKRRRGFQRRIYHKT